MSKKGRDKTTEREKKRTKRREKRSYFLGNLARQMDPS